MRDRYDSLPTSRSTTLVLATAIFAAGVAGIMAGGCGSGTGLATNSVTMCAEASCSSPRPASPSMLCPDDSLAGPACIKHADGMCGWAILTCPIERGPSGQGGATGGNGLGAAGGRASSDGGAGGQTAGGTAGVIASAGGAIGIGTGGIAFSTGGTIGTGGDQPTGGTFGGGGTLGGGGFGAGGSSGPGNIWGTGGNGSFSWTGNGASRSATGYYEENLALSGDSYIITIAADGGASSAPCALTGLFPAVPPPPGMYPMADVNAAQADGTFVSRCSTSGGAAATGDESTSGQVFLSQSAPGIVEGSFTMHANRHFSGTGGAGVPVVFSGAFSVGCRDGRPITDPACAFRSMTP